MADFDDPAISGGQESTPLENKFTLFAMDKAKGWQESKIKPLATIGTVQQFWQMYQHIKRPSQLANQSVINIFVEGVKPVWECPEHAHGAAWNLRINKGHADQLWENLLLGLIGEQFTDGNNVTGVVLDVGHNLDKIAVWFREGENQQVTQQLRKDLIRIMDLPPDIKMECKQFFPSQPKPAPGGRDLKPYRAPRKESD